MASDIETVVRASQRLEALLTHEYAATGNGLGEKFHSVREHVPDGIDRAMNYIIGTRNDVVHNPDGVIRDKRNFEMVVDDLMVALRRQDTSAVTSYYGSNNGEKWYTRALDECCQSAGAFLNRRPIFFFVFVFCTMLASVPILVGLGGWWARRKSTRGFLTKSYSTNERPIYLRFWVWSLMLLGVLLVVERYILMAEVVTA